MVNFPWAPGILRSGLGMGVILLACLLVSGNRAYIASFAQSASEAIESIHAFDRLSETEGWVWFGERLYLTGDAGASWQEITPPLVGELELAAVDFKNAANGLVILTSTVANGENNLFLARTSNGGQNWLISPLLLKDEDRFLPIAQHYLTMWDEHTLWVVQKLASSANFSRGILYRTLDGGKTWRRLELPIAAPIQAENALDLWLRGGARGNEIYRSFDGGETWIAVASDSGPSEELGDGVREPRMISASMGWKLEQKGNCEPQTISQSPDGSTRQSLQCRTVVRLWSTEDGGRSWAAVTLPHGQSSLITEETITTSTSIVPSSFLPLGEEAPNTPLVATMQGAAFDKCEIPPLNKLSVWRTQSPYRAVNLYIGGIHRACENVSLTPQFIAQLRQQGWGLIPTWVGLQARCTNFKYRMSKYPREAYLEGRNEAEAATLAAQQLGLTNSAGSGSVIYYDLEHYNISNLECNLAAQAFINGWVERMSELGMIGGVYSTGRPLSQFADLPNPPPVIWAAHWIYPAYNPEATVWDVLGLSNDLWKDRQRLRQYTGGHNETWGNVTLNIDSNVMDGMISYHLYIPGGLDYQFFLPLITR